MATVVLSNKIDETDGSVVFAVSEPISNVRFSEMKNVKKQLKVLYKKRYLLNNRKVFDKAIMQKEFGR